MKELGYKRRDSRRYLCTLGFGPCFILIMRVEFMGLFIVFNGIWVLTWEYGDADRIGGRNLLSYI